MATDQVDIEVRVVENKLRALIPPGTEVADTITTIMKIVAVVVL